ncbi:transposase [Rhodovulum sulfidophilum]|nr:transposase [Rhodovulum sulfidophilum]
MNRKRFTEEQIMSVLKESEAGAKTDDICRHHGISSATFYSWRKEYGGMEAGDAKRLRVLEAENAKLKRIVADQMLDMSDMKYLLGVVAKSNKSASAAACTKCPAAKATR